jgi:hypothetical protein
LADTDEDDTEDDDEEEEEDISDAFVTVTCWLRGEGATCVAAL